MALEEKGPVGLHLPDPNFFEVQSLVDAERLIGTYQYLKDFTLTLVPSDLVGNSFVYTRHDHSAHHSFLLGCVTGIEVQEAVQDGVSIIHVMDAVGEAEHVLG
jgi:hypothetical protein